MTTPTSSTRSATSSTAEGYRVARARHGVEALERVDARAARDHPARPDDAGDGRGRVRRRRCASAGRRRGIPIVVISADGNPQRAASVGAAGYLAKPFDIDALLSQVAR